MPLKSIALIEKVKAEVASTDPNLDRKALFVYQVNIMEGGKQIDQYVLDLKQMKAYDGACQGTADVTITVDDEDLFQMSTGKLPMEDAFIKGSLKFEGDVNGVKVMRKLAQLFLK